MRRQVLILTIAVQFLLAGAMPAGEPGPVGPSASVGSYLREGRAQAGAAALQAELLARPDDRELRFAAGVMQVLAAIEKVGQASWVGGLRRNVDLGPARIVIPPTPGPAVSDYEFSRRTIEVLLRDLEAAQATLEPLEGVDVRLPLDFTGAHLDFNGNLSADPGEAILEVLRTPGSPVGAAQDAGPSLAVCLDRGDVSWLRGYCHLLSGWLELALAYDARPIFDAVFPCVMMERTTAAATCPHPWRHDMIADIVISLHRSNFRLLDPQGPPRALAHFQETIRLGRLSWDDILLEADNEHEWIPNPRQASVLHGITITEEMVTAWRGVLDEVQAVLEGRTVIRHPLLKDESKGVNVRLMRAEPRDFDLVEVVHGAGALPYLTGGTIADQGKAERLASSFGGNFWGFAAWFN